jgi:hypothetical protein
MLNRDELITLVAQELAKVEGGWQHLELLLANATHAAKHLVEKLLQDGHLIASEKEEGK